MSERASFEEDENAKHDILTIPITIVLLARFARRSVINQQLYFWRDFVFWKDRQLHHWR